MAMDVMRGDMNIDQYLGLSKEQKKSYDFQLAKKIKIQKLQPGDLVQIAPWCKNKFKLAHVVDTPWWDKYKASILYLDNLSAEPSTAHVHNLILLQGKPHD